MSLLYLYIPHHYFFAYFIFFSALIVTIRSDIETMLISCYATLYIVPLAFLTSYCKLLPISLSESIVGALFGYFTLWGINKIFKSIKKYDGIGEGDFDLLCLIGSFTGIIGCWAAITIGSMLGSLYGLCNLLIAHMHSDDTNFLTTKIPFGPFLSTGALLYIFLQKHITSLFICL